MTSADLEQLETWIDKHGLATILGSLGNICRDKAEHVQVYWQDHELADAWLHNGMMLEDTTIDLRETQ